MVDSTRWSGQAHQEPGHPACRVTGGLPFSPAKA